MIFQIYFLSLFLASGNFIVLFPVVSSPQVDLYSRTSSEVRLLVSQLCGFSYTNKSLKYSIRVLNLAYFDCYKLDIFLENQACQGNAFHCTTGFNLWDHSALYTVLQYHIMCYLALWTCTKLCNHYYYWFAWLLEPRISFHKVKSRLL